MLRDQLGIGGCVAADRGLKMQHMKRYRIPEDFDKDVKETSPKVSQIVHKVQKLIGAIAHLFGLFLA